MHQDEAIDCPVCPATTVAPGETQCPQCGTDIAPLRRVRELADSLRVSETGDGKPKRLLRPVVLAVAGVFLVVIAAAFFLGELAYKTFSGEYRTLKSQAKELEGNRLEQSRLAAEVQALRSELKSRPGAEPIGRDLLEAFYRDAEGIEGVQLQREPDAVLIIPAEGLFARGSRNIMPERREMLGRLAALLREHSDSLSLQLLGHCDSTPSSSDPVYGNWLLGMARASAVASYLAEAGGLLPTSIRICSLGDTRPPFDNNREDNWQRNRTVVLRIEADLSTPLLSGEGR